MLAHASGRDYAAGEPRWYTCFAARDLTNDGRQREDRLRNPNYHRILETSV